MKIRIATFNVENLFSRPKEMGGRLRLGSGTNGEARAARAP